MTAAPADAACECVPPASRDEAFMRATTAFTGTAVSSNNGDPVVVTFAVDGVEKGNPPASVAVRTAASPEDCGVGFVVGGRYQVYAVDDGAGLRADVCGGSHELAFPPAYEDAVPVPFDGGGNDLGPQPAGWGEGNPALAVGGGIVLVCLTAAASAAWNRRKQRRHEPSTSTPSLS